MTRVEFRVMETKTYYHLYSMRLILALQRRGILNCAKADLAFKKHAIKVLEYQIQRLNYVGKRMIDSKEES